MMDLSFLSDDELVKLHETAEFEEVKLGEQAEAKFALVVQALVEIKRRENNEFLPMQCTPKLMHALCWIQLLGISDKNQLRAIITEACS